MISNVDRIAEQVVGLVEGGLSRAVEDGPVRVLVVGSQRRRCSPTMVARRIHMLADQLGPMTADEARDSALLRHAARLGEGTGRRPLRAPHHSCSHAAIVGGRYDTEADAIIDARSVGEASLAHNGVLYLDEVGEFRLTTLAAIDTAVSEGRCGPWPSRPRFIVFGSAACRCDSYKGRRCVCNGPGAAGREGARWRERHAYRVEAILRPHVTVNVAELNNSEAIRLIEKLDALVASGLRGAA